MQQELSTNFPISADGTQTVAVELQLGAAVRAELRRPEGIDAKAKTVLFGQRGGGPRPTPES
jgi:hypothetical protein